MTRTQGAHENFVKTLSFLLSLLVKSIDEVIRLSSIDDVDTTGG